MFSNNKGFCVVSLDLPKIGYKKKAKGVWGHLNRGITPFTLSPQLTLLNSAVHCLLCEIVASKKIILLLENQRKLHQRSANYF